MNYHCKNCDYYDPWDHPKMGGYNNEHWGEPGGVIPEEDQKKMLEFAEKFGKAAAKLESGLIEKATVKVLHKEAEKEKKQHI